jgi:hypothetical protein
VPDERVQPPKPLRGLRRKTDAELRALAEGGATDELVDEILEGYDYEARLEDALRRRTR